MSPGMVSSSVVQMLRDAHHQGRPSWPNFDTITTGAQYRVLHRLCQDWIPPGGRVLDWGAGNGHASIYLSRAGFTATGYSLEAFSYQDLLGSSAYRFVAADPNAPASLPFDDAEFDAVLSVGVLEHVRETGGTESASLRQILRVLRPGGVMICIHFPNAGSWIEAFARLRGVWRHTHRCSRSEALGLFNASGFRVERYGRYGLLPRNRIASIIPRKVCDSVLFSRIYDTADRVGSTLLPWFVQNHFIVARRP